MSGRRSRKQGAAPGAWLTGVIGAAVLAGTAALSAACGASVADDNYLGVCVDPHTGMRVADQFCGGTNDLTGAALDSLGYYWDYYPPSYSGTIIAVGYPEIGRAHV